MTGRALAEPAVLDVVSVPAGHPYVEHLRSARPGPEAVRVRPDPDPLDPSRVAAGPWWPPVALRPEWLAEQRCDVLHLHFGFDASSPADLSRLLEVARDRRIAVVLTVHDLRNPHQPDPATLDAQLDVLVPGADAVLTLTDQAAGVIRRRWGRVAEVVAHPHLVEPGLAARLRAERRAAGRPRRRVVGVAVKSLRPNTDPLRLLPTLERTVAARDDAVLRVTAHHDVRRSASRGDAGARALTAWLDVAAGRGVEVVWHDRLDDEALARDLAGLHVAVLPYRFGTHSGWLEACHDVGTRVLAPSHGCYAAQGADGVYDADERTVDETSLAAGLLDLLRRDPVELAGPEADVRAAQRDALAATHERLYRRLVERAGRAGDRTVEEVAR